jgi:PAS domain-containing protein
MQGNKPTGTARSAALRQRAEALIAAKGPSGPTTSPEDVLALVQELHTHRIELELQNEDLRQAQSALEQSRQRFSDLYDFAPVGYLTLSDRGMIVEANLKAAEILNVERRELMQQPFSAFIIPEDQDIFYRYRCRRKSKGDGYQEISRKTGGP